MYCTGCVRRAIRLDGIDTGDSESLSHVENLSSGSIDTRGSSSYGLLENEWDG